jgi:hypothetical protein
MRGFLGVVAATFAVGCIETGVEQDVPKWDSPNPRPVQGEYVEDSFVQEQPTQADILFVISNWWSMEQAYAELVDSFDGLLDVFVGSGVDYHIGVISTDTDHSWEYGKLHEEDGVRFIGTDTPDPYGTFAKMATMDASGCVGPRRPRDATMLALEMHDDGWNAGFRREEASLHTVFVSDDRDLSTMVSLDEWIYWYDSYTNTPEIDTLSTIVDFAKDGANLEATQRLGGSSHPVTSRPWANVLAEIGLRARGMRREYFLSSTPLDGTLQVTVTTPAGAELRFDEGALEEGGDYGYDTVRNSIQFHEFEPETASTITIGYETR